MRPLLLISALVWAGCAAETAPQPPPTDRFVYPSGIVHRQVDGSPNGALYVASANFDKCFDTGAVLALDLDELGLPPIGTPVGPDGPVAIQDLQVGPENSVQIESFAGQMALGKNSEGGPRLFVPTRAEENYLHAIDILGKTTLSCANGLGQNCILGALSLTSGIEGSEADQPRAPAPLGATVDEQGGVWVTHVEAADSPARSAQNPQTYVVHIPDAGGELSVGKKNFIPLASGGLTIGGTHATAVGRKYVYATGRSYVAGQVTQPATFLLRMIDREDTTRVLPTELLAIYGTLEARDVLLGGYELPPLDRERLYIVARGPDILLVVDVLGATSSQPRVTVVNSVLLPGGASYAGLIQRGTLGGGDDIVAVTCTATTRTEGAVVLYDDRLGQIAAQVNDVGRQPFGIAVQHDEAANQARLFVTNFSDGRIAVIDLADLTNPQDAELVAYLGTPQGRDEKQGTSTCQPQEANP